MINKDKLNLAAPLDFQQIAQRVMGIDHIGVQCDDIHKCEEMHQVIRKLDKLDRFDAVRLLMHVIHVQQLQLLDQVFESNSDNPFKDMVDFKGIDTYVKCFSPTMETLY